MRRCSEPYHIYAACIFCLDSITLDLIAIEITSRDLRFLTVCWDLLEYVWKPNLISSILWSFMKIIYKIGFQMVLSWSKFHKWVSERRSNSTICWWTPLEGCAGENKPIGSPLFPPSTLLSLFSSLHTNEQPESLFPLFLHSCIDTFIYFTYLFTCLLI